MSNSTDQEKRNTKVCERFINEVWNKYDLDVAKEILTSDFTFHLNNVSFETGPEPFLQIITDVANTNESFEIKIEDLIAKNEKVAIRWTFKGKNKMFGVDTANSGIFVVHFRDGKILECWQLVDMLTHYTHLGFQLVPPDNPGKQDEKAAGVIVHVIRVVDGVGQFLYLRRSYGSYKDQWWPVAGNAKSGENPIQTALRELKEETDLIPLEIYKLGMSIPNVDGKSKLEGMVAFVEPTSMVRLNREHSEFCWFGVQKAIEEVSPFGVPFIRHMESRFLVAQPPKDSRIWQA
ncbi:MAG: NUDIX domain-containing protein [Proteobacteria bacterium]|nr:NUDIX domain-containing protein [Pseudomonadota bacterium]